MSFLSCGFFVKFTQKKNMQEDSGLAEYHFLTKQKAILKMSFGDTLVKPKSPEVPKPYLDDNFISWFGDVAPWGLNNLYPEDVYNLAIKNPIIAPVIREKTNFISMLKYKIGQVEYRDGEEVFVPKENKEIREFLKKINFKNYIFNTAKNLYWLNHAFVEVVLGTNNKIINISTHDTTHCRYSLQNEYGRINKCYINANWRDITSQNHKYTLTREVIQRDYNPVADLQDKAKPYSHFIYPLFESEITHTYYPMAAWHSAINAKVLEWANSIPEYKAALMRHQLSADYLIEIAKNYWTERYKDWDEKPELKEQRKKDVRKEIEENLIGSENAAKNIFAPMFVNEYEGKSFSFIKITPINKDSIDGRYVEDSQEACSLLLFALGMPVDLLGNLPSSSGMGGGSGSPTREHFNIYVQKIQPTIDLIFEPFNRMIFEYNGWNNWEIRAEIPALQTLDNVTPSNRV
jgi:hypothetical protein